MRGSRRGNGKSDAERTLGEWEQRSANAGFALRCLCFLLFEVFDNAFDMAMFPPAGILLVWLAVESGRGRTYAETRTTT